MAARLVEDTGGGEMFKVAGLNAQRSKRVPR